MSNINCELQPLELKSQLTLSTTLRRVLPIPVSLAVKKDMITPPSLMKFHVNLKELMAEKYTA